MKKALIRFIDKLFGKDWVEFHTPLSTQEAVEKLSQETQTWPLILRTGLCGSVKPHRVRLSWVIPMFGNSWAPFFYGAFETANGQTVLKGYFAVAWFIRVFSAFWLGFVGLMTVVFLLLAIFIPAQPSNPPEDGIATRIVIALGSLVMVIFFTGLVQFCFWLSRDDKKKMTNRIREILQSP
jgi:hypothetical protein